MIWDENCTRLMRVAAGMNRIAISDEMKQRKHTE